MFPARRVSTAGAPKGFTVNRVDQLSGIVLAVCAGALFLIVVSYLAKRRRGLVDSRTEDRFSADLRVLTVAHARREADRSHERESRTLAAGGPRRGHVLSAATHRTRKETAMKRPYGVEDRAVARAHQRVAAQRQRLDDARARRAAAAKRRLLLTCVLLLGSVAGWVAVVVSALTWIVPMATTLLLGLVLVLGRRAAVAGQRFDAETVADLKDAQEDAVEAQEQAMRRRRAPSEVADFAMVDPDMNVRRVPQSAIGGDEWTPVPVPTPAYQLKARASRVVRTSAAARAERERQAQDVVEANRDSESPAVSTDEALPAPVEASVAEQLAAVQEQALQHPPKKKSDKKGVRPSTSAETRSGQTDEHQPLAPAREDAANIDLDAVLRRRRVAGE